MNSQPIVLRPGAAPRFRDPVNGLLHATALIVSLVGTGVLLWAVRQDPMRMLSALVYGLGMAGCFLASSLHHLIKGERELELRLLRLDHAAIYPFIAGTYTPVCLQVLPRPTGPAILVLVWVMAIAGIVYKLLFAPDPANVVDPPELRDTLGYVAMGWVVAWQTAALVARSHPGSLPLAVLGGLAYSLGGLILSFRLFDFRPGRLGHHEIWHLCVIAGAACFYGYVWLNLAT